MFRETVTILSNAKSETFPIMDIAPRWSWPIIRRSGRVRVGRYAFAKVDRTDRGNLCVQSVYACRSSVSVAQVWMDVIGKIIPLDFCAAPGKNLADRE